MIVSKKDRANIMEQGEQRTIKFDDRNLTKQINLRELVDVIDRLTSKIEFCFNKFQEPEKLLFLRIVELSQSKISSIKFETDIFEFR